jgi:hypothetical protein
VPVGGVLQEGAGTLRTQELRPACPKRYATNVGIASRLSQKRGRDMRRRDAGTLRTLELPPACPKNGEGTCAGEMPVHCERWNCLPPVPKTGKGHAQARRLPHSQTQELPPACTKNGRHSN